MRAYGVNSAVLHNNYAVGFLHRRNTLCNNNFCGIGYFGCKRFSYKRVGLGIDCACGVVENNYFRLFKQCARYAKPLLLSARNVCAALLYVFINSSACANLHTRTSSSSVAFISPQRRFSLIVPENSTFFCKTTETALRSVSIS